MTQATVPAVASFPDAPSPCASFDWRRRAIDYDSFVYDWSQQGWFPTIAWDYTHYNMSSDTYKMPSYYGDDRLDTDGTQPLALSLAEADEILDAARVAGRAVGVDYVLRHHPAFELVARLTASPLFGQLRTFSLQNFAQALPGDHWMWDTGKSGGILVEHGVHFFDAYGQIAGAPEDVWGSAPRKESVEVTVRYMSGAIGRYYHEFAWPQHVERTHGIMLFERGHVEIDGWIPERVHGRVASGAAAFDVRFPDRQVAYRSAIVDGMRDLIAKHRRPSHRMVVSAHDARESLSLALQARRAVETRSQQSEGGST